MTVLYVDNIMLISLSMQHVLEIYKSCASDLDVKFKCMVVNCK